MKKKTFSLIVMISFVLILTLPNLYSMFSQEKSNQEVLQHEVTVTLKLVQVYLTDKEGNPVTDLEKSDFVLYDNGKLKTITDFEKHFLFLPGKKIEKKVKEKDEVTKPVPAREISSKLNRKFFILIDLFHNDLFGFNKSKKAALHFINTQVQPSDEVSVLSYFENRGFTLHQYLTNNHQKVQEAIKRIKGVPTLEDSDMGPIEREWKKRKSRQYISELKEFAKSLRYLSGFKNIIFFSSGIPNEFIYNQFRIPNRFGLSNIEAGIYDTVEDMSKELAASNTPVFTINTRGARGFSEGYIERTQPFSKESRESERGKRGDHYLRFMSDISGGDYFADVEFYETISEKINAVTGNYYVLGYYIDELWDGKYHEIKVEVKRKGCEVHAQGGYYNPKPFSEFSEFEKQLHLLDLALSEQPYFQDALTFPLLTLPCSQQKNSNLVLLSEIPREKISEVVDSNYEIITLIFDEENSIVDSSRGEVNFAEIPEKTIYQYTIWSLLPGRYECRLVIRNLKTGIGAVGASSITIPEKTEPSFKIYPPLLLIPEKKAYYLKFQNEQDDKSGRTLSSIDNIFPFLSNKHSPLVEELDQSVSSLLAILRCSADGAQKPKIELFANLFYSESVGVATLPLEIIASKMDGKYNILLVKLKLPPLKHGEYSLILIAEDTTTKSRSQASRTFKVR